MVGKATLIGCGCSWDSRGGVLGGLSNTSETGLEVPPLPLAAEQTKGHQMTKKIERNSTFDGIYPFWARDNRIRSGWASRDSIKRRQQRFGHGGTII